jgi:tetratricopeptide (TPR) repeat protein
LLSYADYQFGQPIIGRDYRERSNGQRIANWNVDINILLRININLTNIYAANASLSILNRDNKMYPHLERSHRILRPWMVTVDSDATNQSNSLSFEQTNQILSMSFQTERNITLVAINRNQFDLAEGYCHRCLVNSRRFGVEGEYKITSILDALTTYVSLREHQGNFTGALPFAEEAYNLVVDAYDPVHLQVQIAASCLINCLIKKGDLFNAERYAEQTYANLRDIKNGIDQESDAVSEGAFNLATVILRQDDGDLIKAEKLAGESLHIRTQLNGPDHDRVGLSNILLAKILKVQGKLGDETKELLERALAIHIRNEGPDGPNTAAATINIGRLYYQLAMTQTIVGTKRIQLLLAKSSFQEASHIGTKIYSPTHPDRVGVAPLLSAVLNELSKV